MRTGRPPTFPANCYIRLDPEDSHLYDLSWSFLRTPHNVYAVRKAPDGSTVLLHRLVTGAKEGEVVDHLNRDGLDNRKCNLRVCSQKENILRAYPKGGVYRKGRQWTVQMGGKYLGGFPTQEEAEAVRKAEWEKRVG